jgi:hypothetical protein
MDEKNESPIGRRRLLRSAGAVAAGVAGAGVAGAVAATPASADQGQPVLAGLNNTATGTTGIQLTANSSKAALQLSNPAGPALTAVPVSLNSVTTAAPAGSVFVDDYGDFWTIGDAGGGRFVNKTYSPTWSLMPVPINPFRWLDTRGINPGTANVVPGSGTISGGRIIPRGTNQPDLVLDFSDILFENYVAVQMNISIHNSSRDGWISVWGDGDWPGTVTVNYLEGRVVGGYSHSELTGVFYDSTEAFGRLKIKLTDAAAVIIDVVGFITPDSYSLFQPAAAAKLGAASARQPKVTPRKKI